MDVGHGCAVARARLGPEGILRRTRASHILLTCRALHAVVERRRRRMHCSAPASASRSKAHTSYFHHVCTVHPCKQPVHSGRMKLRGQKQPPSDQCHHPERSLRSASRHWPCTMSGESFRTTCTHEQHACGLSRALLALSRHRAWCYAAGADEQRRSDTSTSTKACERARGLGGTDRGVKSALP